MVGHVQPLDYTHQPEAICLTSQIRQAVPSVYNLGASPNETLQAPVISPGHLPGPKPSWRNLWSRPEPPSSVGLMAFWSQISGWNEHREVFAYSLKPQRFAAPIHHRCHSKQLQRTGAPCPASVSAPTLGSQENHRDVRRVCFSFFLVCWLGWVGFALFWF